MRRAFNVLSLTLPPVLAVVLAVVLSASCTSSQDGSPEITGDVVEQMFELQSADTVFVLRSARGLQPLPDVWVFGRWPFYEEDLVGLESDLGLDIEQVGASVDVGQISILATSADAKNVIERIRTESAWGPDLEVAEVNGWTVVSFGDLLDPRRRSSLRSYGQSGTIGLKETDWGTLFVWSPRPGELQAALDNQAPNLRSELVATAIERHPDWDDIEGRPSMDIDDLLDTELGAEFYADVVRIGAYSAPLNEVVYVTEGSETFLLIDHETESAALANASRIPKAAEAYAGLIGEPSDEQYRSPKLTGTVLEFEVTNVDNQVGHSLIVELYARSEEADYVD